MCMEFKIIFWIIIGIIYLITRARKKAAQQPTIDPRNFDQSENPNRIPGKPVTFEDLLREIQSAKAPVEPKPEPKPYYEAPSYPKYEDYDDNLEDEEKSLEEVNYDQRKTDNIYDVYEKAKQAAFQRPSLEETMKVEDTVV